MRAPMTASLPVIVGFVVHMPTNLTIVRLLEEAER